MGSPLPEAGTLFETRPGPKKKDFHKKIPPPLLPLPPDSNPKKLEKRPASERQAQAKAVKKKEKLEIFL